MIRVLTPAEKEHAICVQVAAFIADPCMRWNWSKSSAYLESFPGFVSAFGGPAFEHESAYVDETFGGVALWFAPGGTPDGDAIESIARATVEKDRQDDLFAVLEQMENHHPTEPHWYLSLIGVDPARRGQGIGAELLQHTLAITDEQGLPAYLESSNPANVSLYRRHGFEELGQIRVGDYPVVTPMIRPAR